MEDKELWKSRCVERVGGRKGGRTRTFRLMSHHMAAGRRGRENGWLMEVAVLASRQTGGAAAAAPLTQGGREGGMDGRMDWEFSLGP